MKIEQARGLRWRSRKSGQTVAIWVARQDIIKRGFRPETQEIWRGLEGDLDESVRGYIRDECNRLQNQMLAFARGGLPETSPFNGSMGSLVDHYQSDPDSPFRNLRFASRKRYESALRAMKHRVGARRLADLTFRDFKGWYEKMRWPEGKDGPDQSYAAHFFIGMVRVVVNFGVVAEVYRPSEINHCARLSAVLSNMEFEGGRPRSKHLDRSGAESVITQAQAAGRGSIAFAQALQFELNLRQKDVIGEWVPLAEPGTSEYLHNGKKWIAGLDWRNVSPDLILTHTLSKSMRGQDGVRARTGKVLEWDLKLYPLVMAEIAKMPVEARTGAMVKDEKAGRPWYARHFREVWRKIASAAGIPGDVKNMDSRAGGITETLEATGGNLDAARKSAGHSHINMTQRYSRDALTTTNKIAVLRSGLHKNDGGTG